MSSESPQNVQQVFVGIDVAKEKFDVHLWPTTRVLKFDNTPAGIGELIEALSPYAVALIVIEAAGRYERRCAFELMDAGFEVAIVNPRHGLSNSTRSTDDRVGNAYLTKQSNFYSAISLATLS